MSESYRSLTRAEKQIVNAAKLHGFEVEDLTYDRTYRDWHVRFSDGDWLLIDSAAVAEAEFACHRHYLAPLPRDGEVTMTARGFAADLASARADRLPAMALRPEGDDPDVMDDIVVKDVSMFRAEAMSEKDWWLCCYFANGERVTFNMEARCRPRRLSCTVGERPSDWVDLDA